MVVSIREYTKIFDLDPSGSSKLGKQRKFNVESVQGSTQHKFSWVRQNWETRENFAKKVQYTGCYALLEIGAFGFVKTGNPGSIVLSSIVKLTKTKQNIA